MKFIEPSPFHVNVFRRDFSGPVLPPVNLYPERLSWSAFGGPDQASCSARGAVEDLLDLASLLRCGVMIRDQVNTPVWWGFVDEVIIFFENIQLKVSLENLFNRVKVQYSFISPDNKLADQFETSTINNPQSQLEFGIKETVIHETNLDENFANALRDTFLSQHAFPFSELSQRSPEGCSSSKSGLRPSKPGEVSAQLHCSGWFKTLAWRNYHNPEGFYANYGPGPGVFAFGDSSTHRYVGQSFKPEADVYLKYAYFKIRAEAAPTTNLTAKLYTQTNYYPGSLLAASQAVPPSEVNDSKYAWIRFTFPTPYLLSSGEIYWIVVDPGGVNSSNYFYIKADENMSFPQLYRMGRYYNQSSGTWLPIPSETDPGSKPDLVFRFVCLSDTGSQLFDIASAGDQFFEKIIGLTTGVQSSPFRNNGFDCLKEIEALMKAGTSNKRWVLASVTPERFLKFYEQPDTDEADIYIDSKSRFFTKHQVQLPSYLPPVGRFARLAATTRVSLPWDRNRLPACFIAYVEYFPQTGTVSVRNEILRN